MYFPTCLAFAAVLADVVHSSTWGLSTSLQGRQQSASCVTDSEPPQAQLALCQATNKSSICWPPAGARLCFPGAQTFYWSPAYFPYPGTVGLFLHDPSELNLTVEDVLLSNVSKPNITPASTIISLNQTDYDTFAPTHTFKVWAVGVTLGDSNITIAQDPPTYTLVPAPLPTMTDGSNGDNDGVTVSTISIIVVAIVAVIFLIAFVSFCCCGCCRVRRTRPNSGSDSGPYRSSAMGPVPFYQISQSGPRIYRPEVQIPGLPRARLTDPRRQGVHDYIDEQLPAYRKERDGENPPAYDQASTGADQSVGRTQITQETNDAGGNSHIVSESARPGDGTEQGTDSNTVQDSGAQERGNNAP